MKPSKLVIATYNRHKLGEIQRILHAHLPSIDITQISCAADYDLPQPREDGISFMQNALLKARAITRALGIPALADDSGICVDVLGGAPGIFSARWAGAHGDDAANLDLLLAQLADVPQQYRQANFTCCAALVFPDGREFTELGTIEGTLRYERAGKDGFGYDPIFQPLGMQQTLAEISAEAKNQISHRAAAFAKIAPIIGRELAN
ncbi:XTP/dITP diphosphohydrolase [Arcanobacterium hippocoleae]|uniref:dITP/XTP pyrophosphatase n=2 Tax=Arcanobacterium hippocoleae TaxID=149017 RepID=A0ABU1SZP5_9ACTO|nr:RdgB/HAM1 family non-canonical purine NTP pyrophosphatase [Arcanobacterium hippocoleae]MDR6938560.1 XTP/dITP diphosphohydrolase [Arcanobacterium hippocoleae]